MKESWTGFPGVAFEDAIMGVAAGPISDRTKEHLVTADTSVVRLRRLLIEAAGAVAKGETPRGADYSDCTGLSAPDGLFAPDVNWRDLVPQHRQPVADATEA